MRLFVLDINRLTFIKSNFVGLDVCVCWAFWLDHIDVYIVESVICLHDRRPFGTCCFYYMKHINAIKLINLILLSNGS